MPLLLAAAATATATAKVFVNEVYCFDKQLIIYFGINTGQFCMSVFFFRAFSLQNVP